MKNIFVSLLAFLLIEIYYSLFVIRKNKKYDPNKATSEVKLLVQKYRVDMNKVHYPAFLKTIALINALDIAIVIYWVTFIPKLNVECFVAIVLIIPVILVSYAIFGNYLKKKGLVQNERNEKHKRNRK